MSRKHAILSASGAKRWMSCPPSARLEEQIKDESSSFAEEGSLAHAIGEAVLRLQYAVISQERYKLTREELDKSEYYCPEMLDYVEDYVDFVTERYNAALARSPDALIMIEERLDFSAYVPEGFGTGDILIITDGEIEVIDLKYGKGVPVSAEGNPQMRLYGLGALEMYGFLYSIESVKMTVYQPRLDNISTEEMGAAALQDWGDYEVKPAAALAFVGEGEFCAGDHCKFCKLKATCRARAEANLALAAYDFAKPPTLSIEEIAEILESAEELQKWAADVQSHALTQAEKHGIKFPGWKLVEGRANRKYCDSETVLEVLKLEGYDEDTIAPRSTLGITAMEKALGRKNFENLLGDLILKPPGKPTLVKESDKRPEINSTASAAVDFG
jgi:hypothetical protein